MLFVLLAVGSLEALDRLGNILGARAVGDQERVGGVDDDEVVDTDGRDHAALGVDVAVLGIGEQRVAVGVIAMLIVRRDFPDRRPRSHVVPADVDRQHGDAFRFLHHSVVDGDVGRACVFGGAETLKADVLRAIVVGLPCSVEDFGGKSLQLVQEGFGVQHEDAGVPEVGPFGQVGTRGRRIGLLGEAVDAIGSGRTVDGGTHAQIAVTGMGFGGLDSEQDEPSGGGDFGSAVDRVNEIGLVPDDMIGRHDDENGVTPLGDRRQGGNGDCWGGVAGNRFEYDRLWRDAGLLEFFAHQEAMRVVAHEDRIVEAGGWRQTLERGAEEARLLAAEEADELLGVERAR